MNDIFVNCVFVILELVRTRSTDNEDRFKFALNISKVRNGEDRRTTLMVRNIPNKYTQKLLLQVRKLRRLNDENEEEL